MRRRTRVAHAGRRARAAACLTVSALVLAGCAVERVAGDPIAQPAEPGVASDAERPPVSPRLAPGVLAAPSSSAYAVEGRDMRLVRLGEDELALQFEFANGTDERLRVDDLGIDEVERSLLLADLPRGTAYEMLSAYGIDGRLSESNDEYVEPGDSVTVTAVFTAPPAETSSLMVLVDGLLPVKVPVQPAGSGLHDDAVLHDATESESNVSPLICGTKGPQDDAGQTPVEIRLPSDVLFAFGSAELSPAAQSALEALDEQITGTSGTITVEGHTDNVGDDPSNQTLSEQRAAAVSDALRGNIGGGFDYQTEGFGETDPIALNANPDGSDNPDGRALNRRVEVRVGSTATVPAQLEALPASTDLSEAGLEATPNAITRVDGHLLAEITVTNPTAGPVELAFGSGLTPFYGDPTGLTLADRTSQQRHELCHIPSRSHDFYSLANPGTDYEPSEGNNVPPGAEITFWGVYPAPPAGVSSLDMEIGGFGVVQPVPITG